MLTIPNYISICVEEIELFQEKHLQMMFAHHKIKFWRMNILSCRLELVDEKIQEEYNFVEIGAELLKILKELKKIGLDWCNSVMFFAAIYSLEGANFGHLKIERDTMQVEHCQPNTCISKPVVEYFKI